MLTGVSRTYGLTPRELAIDRVVRGWWRGLVNTGRAEPVETAFRGVRLPPRELSERERRIDQAVRSWIGRYGRGDRQRVLHETLLPRHFLK